MCVFETLESDSDTQIFPQAVVRAEADITDVGAQRVNDFFHIFKLLWGKICVIEQPVV